MTPLWLRGHRVVLVDEATEHVVTNDVDRRGGISMVPVRVGTPRSIPRWGRCRL
jgi:hypothetical protein